MLEDLHMKNKKVVGIFGSEREALEVIKCLKSMGYRDTEVSVIAKNSHRLDEIIEKTNVDMTDINIENGASLVSISGQEVREVLFLKYEFFTLPGTEPFAASGPVAAAFNEFASHADTDDEANATLEDMATAIENLGINKEDAQLYSSYIDRGNLIITVDENAQLKASEISQCYIKYNTLVQ